jgi:hypothetical protein
MIRLPNGLTLCLWGEHEQRSRQEIDSILYQCRGDDSLLLQMRALLHDRNGMAGTDLLDGDHVLDSIASLIQSGELMLFGTPDFRTERSPGAEPVRTVVSSPPPRRAAQARVAPAPPPEPPTISPAVNRAALVAVMRSAAASGVPLCDT